MELATSELTDYYYQCYSLPFVTEDKTRTVSRANGGTFSDGFQRVRQVFIRYPIAPRDRLKEVIDRWSNPYYQSSAANTMSLKVDQLEVSINIPMQSSEEGAIQYINQVQEAVKQSLEWKNKNVEVGNARIKSEISAYIEQRKNVISHDNDLMERIFTKIPIQLERDRSLQNTIDLSIRKQTEIIMPKPKPLEEFYLDRAKVIEIVNFISGACRWFERAPKAFLRLEEEDLRDILLGGLNMIFKNSVTAETFSRKGKTDIHLCIPNGEILIAECKIWAGEEYYSNGIGQLFGYLTWRENFGLFLTFSRNKGFTEVISKAKEVTAKHPSFIPNSLTDIGSSYFTSLHAFPGDQKKRVEIHHYLFNLFFEESSR